ncbi:hypothetical protein [Dongshaea marina]|uniref:hypothetical protein n=1 Tax=Dongshaea marina TaxID=2047966 RepID=UPI000D3EDA5D|nr:hypothetical protein [Dongshaea marina]
MELAVRIYRQARCSPFTAEKAAEFYSYWASGRVLEARYNRHEIQRYTALLEAAGLDMSPPSEERDREVS